MAIVHTGHMQHPDRRDLHGCAAHLPISSPAVAKDAMGYPHRLSFEYPVSSIRSGGIIIAANDKALQSYNLLHLQDHRVEDHYPDKGPHLVRRQSRNLEFSRTIHRHSHRLSTTPTQSLRSLLPKNPPIHHHAHQDTKLPVRLRSFHKRKPHQTRHVREQQAPQKRPSRRVST